MADGAPLPLRVWPAENPSAVIVALHGFNDYSNGFAMPGPWFAERGISVYAYDQRGFGAAPGRGRWPGSDRLVKDARTMLALVRTRHQGLPVYLLGTSMGAAIAMVSSAGHHNPQADGLILVGPAVRGGSALNPLYAAGLWMAAHTIPWVRLTGDGLGFQASDNIDVLRGLSRDPLVIKATRVDAAYGLVGLMEDASVAAGSVDLPVLLLHGEKDELVPEGPVNGVYDNLNGQTTIGFYPDGWHLLLRDLEREIVWRDIRSWIAAPKTQKVVLPSGLNGHRTASGEPSRTPKIDTGQSLCSAGRI